MISPEMTYMMMIVTMLLGFLMIVFSLAKRVNVMKANVAAIKKVDAEYAEEELEEEVLE